MQKNYTTERLLLNELNIADTDFIFELVNTAAWKKFIGDRNIHNSEDALAYTQKIIDNTNIRYWTVKLKEQQVAVGVITLIKRDYLEHRDIGFAFLPIYGKKGYAFEAATAILNDIVKGNHSSAILATTIEENDNSIKLLEKLGFSFSKKITHDGETLLLYAIATDKILINQLVNIFFNVFNNCDQKPSWETLRNCCIAETVIVKKTGLTESVYNMDSFIEPREKILNDGTITGFKENEVAEETKIIGNIAQRCSRYQKEGYFNGHYFKEYGNKFFQFIKTNSGWKINAMTWEDDPFNTIESAHSCQFE